MSKCPRRETYGDRFIRSAIVEVSRLHRWADEVGADKAVAFKMAGPYWNEFSFTTPNHDEE